MIHPKGCDAMGSQEIRTALRRPDVVHRIPVHDFSGDLCQELLYLNTPSISSIRVSLTRGRPSFTPEDDSRSLMRCQSV